MKGMLESENNRFGTNTVKNKVREESLMNVKSMANCDENHGICIVSPQNAYCMEGK